MIRRLIALYVKKYKPVSAALITLTQQGFAAIE